MTQAAVELLHVDKDGNVTFVCKNCGESRRESVAKYKYQTGSIKIECKCKNVCEVWLEFRQYFRRETSLDGVYYRTSDPDDCRKMIVRNLSLGGCRFEMMKECTLVPGEEILVEFVLDDPKESTIKEKAVVVYLQGYHVGCKFSTLPGRIDSELAFYLRKYQILPFGSSG